MMDNDIKDLVITHDKHIELMSQSIEHLAEAVGTTNSKMEDIVNVLAAQNILMERVNNMDKNLRESFTRVHKNNSTTNDRVSTIEEEHKNNIPTWAVKWVLSLLVLYTITFGIYTVQHIHNLETSSISHYSSDEIRGEYIDDRLNTVTNLLNRNYGAISALKDK